MRVRGIEPLFAVLETAVFNPLYDTPYYYTFIHLGGIEPPSSRYQHEILRPLKYRCLLFTPLLGIEPRSHD